MIACDLLDVGLLSSPPLQTKTKKREAGADLPKCTSCQAPVHSWDFVPVFFHGSIQQTDAGTHGGFNRAQLENLTTANATAKTPGFASVTIEKWQGSEAEDGFIWEEDAMLAAAKQLKALNPDLAVFFWFDSVRIYTRNNTLNPSATAQCGTGNFEPAEFLMTHPTEYLVHNKTGQPAVEPWSGCYIYGFQRPEVRKFWAEHCLNLTASGFVDGCGADASWQTDPAGGTLNATTLAQWTVGHEEAMGALTEALGEGILLGKMPSELGNYVNGVLHEGCASGNETINMLRNLTAVAKDQGRRLVYQCHGTSSVGGHADVDELSSFLIGAGADHYYGFGGWAQKDGTFGSHWAIEFERPLGDPLGDATYDPSSLTWSRSFASGTNVSFDVSTGHGVIAWANV